MNEVDLLKENKDLLKRVMARRMQVCLQSDGGYIEGNAN